MFEVGEAIVWITTRDVVGPEMSVGFGKIVVTSLRHFVISGVV